MNYYPKVLTGLTVARSGWTLLARIRGNDGRLVTRASVSSVSYTVRDLTSATTVVADQALGVSAVLFDTLQTDPRWQMDDADNLGPDDAHGFNFLATIPDTYFTSFDVDDEAPYDVQLHRFRVDVRFVPATGYPFVVPFESTPTASWVE